MKSIPKFTGPNKSLKAISHVKALESLGATFLIKNFGGATAADFQLHWEGNDAGFMLFHPDIYAASFPAIKSEDSSLVDLAKARPVLPARPRLPDKPTDKDIQSYKLLSEMHEDFHTKMVAWFELAWDSLDDADRHIIQSKSMNSGSPRIGIKDIFAHLTSDTYSIVSPAEAEAQIALIRAPLLRTSTLAVELETRLTLADNLAKACPARALVPAQLYSYLSELCLADDLRLTSVVQKFVDRPGFDQHSTSPRDFVDFMVSANRKHMHPLNSGGRAFSDEHGYIPPRTGLGLSALSLTDSPPPPPEQASALGAAAAGPKAGKSISEAEYMEYQRLKKEQLPFGIYCFHHGWQLDHVSSGCSHMRSNSEFTDAQRSYDKPSKAYHPTTIDGVKANIKVAAGCRKPAFWK